MYSFENFVLFWNKIDNYFSPNVNLKKLFNCFLIEKPYNKFVGLKLLCHLKNARKQLNVVELEEFFNYLIADIEKDCVHLKLFIKQQTEDSNELEFEAEFLRMLDDHCSTKITTAHAEFKSTQKIWYGHHLCTREGVKAFSINKPPGISLTEETISKRNALESATDLMEFGLEKYKDKDYKLAEQAYRNAIELLEGIKIPEAFSARLNLGAVIVNLGKLDEALTLYEGVEAYINQLPSEIKNQIIWHSVISQLEQNIQHLAQTIMDLGCKKIQEKDLKCSEYHYRKAVNLLGVRETDNAFISKINLGYIARELGRLDEAFSRYKEVEAHLDRLPSTTRNQIDWPKLVSVLEANMSELGFKYMNLGYQKIVEEKDFKCSEDCFRKAVDLMGMKETHNAFIARINLAYSIAQLGRIEEAFSQYKVIEAHLDRLPSATRNQIEWPTLKNRLKVNLAALPRNTSDKSSVNSILPNRR